MCRYCENIDHIIEVACEKAKDGDKNDVIGGFFFPYKVADLGVFSFYAEGEELCVLFADGQVILFGKNKSYAEQHHPASRHNKRVFKYCPYCGRKL